MFFFFFFKWKTGILLSLRWESNFLKVDSKHHQQESKLAQKEIEIQSKSANISCL